MGPRLTIATMQTASTDDFMRRLQGGPHLLLVADEVHRIGSPQFSRILTTTAGGRLGLSATPERYGDPAGTISIYTFFGGIVPPEISLSDAIRAGRLVPYDYFVHEVMLDGEEQSEWTEITQEIRAVYARIKSSDREVSFSDHLKFLLIRRARILKHAAGKVSLAVSVMENFYANGDRWLVYCDDRRQLGAIVAALTSRGLPAFEYHSAMTGSKEATLDYFSHDGGIVVAIRCLDEGVDIPIVNKALVLASSTNPREFVQRRGRVLRRAPDKTSAEVHDALVLPNSSLGTQDPVARAIAGIEIRRAVHFADTARNWAVRSQLIHIAGTFGLDLSIPASAEGLSLEEEDSLEPQ
jgi:superfamily II DNA or RNA helicase